MGPDKKAKLFTYSSESTALHDAKVSTLATWKLVPLEFHRHTIWQIIRLSTLHQYSHTNAHVTRSFNIFANKFDVWYIKVS